MIMAVKLAYDRLPSNAQRLFAEITEHWKNTRTPYRIAWPRVIGYAGIPPLKPFSSVSPGILDLGGYVTIKTKLDGLHLEPTEEGLETAVIYLLNELGDQS